MFCRPAAVSLPFVCCVVSSLAAEPVGGSRLLPAVETEDLVYTFEPANNGSGPLWGNASSTIVRLGGEVFASGLETLKGVTPLNNVRWLLFRRGATGWELQQADAKGRTREPCPLGCLPDGRLLLSVNPTLTGLEAKSGPAEPQVLELQAAAPRAPGRTVLPVWDGTPAFTEHSYRSFAVDASNGECILLQNVGYTHAEWSFRDRTGQWSAQGRLKWPWGAEYEKPEPVRLCYPALALKDRAVFFLGVSDIVEPNLAWRAEKKAITGQNWDYDFRRLFFAWCPDIRTGTFSDWLEVASREKTCGWLMPYDLWVAPDGGAHLLWRERALDERLRAKFYPDAKQSVALNYAVVRQGQVVSRRSLVLGGEGASGEVPEGARFHVTADQRLFVVYYCGGRAADDKPLAENRVLGIAADGTAGTPVRVPLEHPFTSFVTASWRTGTAPSARLDMLGVTDRAGISYARVNLLSPILAEFDAVVEARPAGSRLLCDGSRSASGHGRIVTWEWDLAGTQASGQTVSRDFDRGGPVRVVLTVADDLGNRKELTRTVTLPLAPRDFGLERWGVALRTEAGEFVSEGGGGVHVRTDKLGASALSLSHWNSRAHWLEWEFEVPGDGEYFCLVRYATPELASRAFSLDGQAQPLLRFAPTGGYGSDRVDNWGQMTPVGPEGKPLAFRLSAGTHRVRLENPDGTGLNLDFFDWIAKNSDSMGAGAQPPTGFRLVSEPDGSAFLLRRRGVLAPTRMQPELGHCFTVLLGPRYPGDGTPGAPGSDLRLLEDGKELGPAHVAHVEVREQGQGRYSHYGTTLYFSTPDNSDPRRNARSYSWRCGEP